MKEKLLVIVCVMLCSGAVHAQFWFGPKVGGQLLMPRYDHEARVDSFKTTSKVNWHAGLAFDYSTKTNFEVHTELVYMRVNNRSRSTDAYETPLNEGGLGGQFVDSKTVNHFISAPMMARMLFFKNSSIMLMAQAGPRLSYWLGGSGVLVSDELKSFGEEQIKYKIMFKDITQEELENTNFPDKHVITKPNRLQYAIDFGFGGVIQFSPSSRLIADVKYSWGHSFMSFNDGNKLNDALLYSEDMEYNTNMLVISFAYMYGYDVKLSKKGKSTNKLGKKKKRTKRY
ncbi:hypothetical protein [Reichenbachiella ulvae]|uniref:Outer membrane protein beta-barrel domain-containing protein n=1 Tax=Reichenbachiella ulvae TaxID=2980104 RepID=A0ABT3CNW5_9BACT|nr:hypothetical protein [Reichenbachiella ulvae]MCV9385428.1 hypothetical protein [Reichenbachiella ulvae]